MKIMRLITISLLFVIVFGLVCAFIKIVDGKIEIADDINFTSALIAYLALVTLLGFEIIMNETRMAKYEQDKEMSMLKEVLAKIYYNSSRINNLKAFAELMQSGALTQEEYDREKKKLLGE